MGVSETPGYVDPQAVQLDGRSGSNCGKRAARLPRSNMPERLIRQGEISVEDRERFNREFGLTARGSFQTGKHWGKRRDC